MRSVPKSRRFTLRVAPWLTAALLVLGISPSWAVPSFGIQTSQPCSACHIGAFGGRLKDAGRDFKLYGYSPSDNKEHFIPFNVNARFSFTHTDADQAAGASDGFDVNDNFAFDGLTASYAGKILDNIGGIARLSYNGIKQAWSWGGADLRYAQDTTLLGYDAVIGAYLNNGPARSDLWENATSGVPTASSSLSKKPRGSFIVNSLGGLVAGAGAYAMIDDTLYVEGAIYDGLNRDTLNALGMDPLNGGDAIKGVIPYGRIAYTRSLDDDRKNVLTLGLLAAQADVYPGGSSASGHNRFTDVGADINYSYAFDPANSTSDFFAARVAFLHEHEDLDASHLLIGTHTSDDISTFRSDITYSFDATFTTNAQYFETAGNRDAKRWGSDGKVDSRGWVAQVDYVPWGKPDSPADWVNVRVTAQYTWYDEFNGRTDNASDRNTFLVGIAIAGTSAQ